MCRNVHSECAVCLVKDSLLETCSGLLRTGYTAMWRTTVPGKSERKHSFGIVVIKFRSPDVVNVVFLQTEGKSQLLPVFIF